jgi:hypothetical protein
MAAAERLTVRDSPTTICANSPVQRSFTARIHIRSPMFQLIQRFDELYRVAEANAPFPRTGVEAEGLNPEVLCTVPLGSAIGRDKDGKPFARGWEQRWSSKHPASYQPAVLAPSEHPCSGPANHESPASTTIQPIATAAMLSSGKRRRCKPRGFRSGTRRSRRAAPQRSVMGTN